MYMQFPVGREFRPCYLLSTVAYRIACLAHLASFSHLAIYPASNSISHLMRHVAQLDTGHLDRLVVDMHLRVLRLTATFPLRYFGTSSSVSILFYQVPNRCLIYAYQADPLQTPLLHLTYPITSLFPPRPTLTMLIYECFTIHVMFT